jgi:glycosyltransferase involved in cell wall biosynthesis
MNLQNTPLVSICIPTYKNPKLLEKCLKSVIEQTYTNLEIIITDDSPNDEVADVIRKFGVDSRIKYFKNTPALGSPENWNAGLKQSKGEYIKIMHHDDWFSIPQSLEIFVEKAVKSKADFICSYCNSVYPDKIVKHKILRQFRSRWAADNDLILYANYLGNPSTTLFKRNEISPVFYDRKSMWFVDMLFYYEFVQKYPKVAYIEEYLIDTAAGLDTQITNSSANAEIRILEFIYIAKKHDLYRKKPFLTKLSFLEILKRYHVNSEADLQKVTRTTITLPFSSVFLRLPVHHQIYNIIKHILILI